ncbi:hypothetical protein HQ865_23165 [Mucilaginibacter mali]|uniref:Uncharacterized protein n=1 Tax=Mucilaginibacter mali TaxID=2740462 RepID=A0A7D4UDI7_9SPHI|nr:hypothetical protein [Mucilaginibacter mali]QKJ32538.1 hypothetical protein HQ865_23165 [Mucilaginibacter mali]
MKKLLLPLLLLLAACRSKPATVVNIVPDKAYGMIKATGLPVYMLNGIQRDSLPVDAWQNLLLVCKMPADTDLRNYQPAIKGKYGISSGAITFTPDTPFKAGQTYFARYYHYDDKISGLDLVLHRRETGKATYTELIFKY